MIHPVANRLYLHSIWSGSYLFSKLQKELNGTALPLGKGIPIKFTVIYIDTPWSARAHFASFTITPKFDNQNI